MCLTERKEKRRYRRRKPRTIQLFSSTFFATTVEGERSGCFGRGRRSVMDPAAQGADPIPSAACVDIKRLRCSTIPDDPVSKVIDSDNSSSWTMPMTPLDDEDLLREILLRLPLKPSSFPRASLVCKRWSCILSDPRFLRRFRKHHQKPLLIGFFDEEQGKATVFTPLLEQTDRIPVASFVRPENLLGSQSWETSFIGCRHGIALFLDRTRCEAILWHPLTGVQRSVAFPPRVGDGKASFIRSAAVLCPNDDEQHMHGDCHISPFKLVLACYDAKATKAFICIYDSKSSVWRYISTTIAMWICWCRPSILIGNALLWLFDGGDILEFDFERLTLAVIEKPANTHVIDSGVDWSFQILREEDNSLGLAILSNPNRSIQLWARKSSCDGVVSWELRKTVQLDELFSGPTCLGKLVLMPGYDEDTNVIFLSSSSHDFILQIESMQFNYIGRRKYRSFRSQGRCWWRWWI